MCFSTKPGVKEGRVDGGRAGKVFAWQSEESSLLLFRGLGESRALPAAGRAEVVMEKRERRRRSDVLVDRICISGVYMCVCVCACVLV